MKLNFRKWIDIIFWIALAWIIIQRVPNWTEHINIQGQVAPQAILSGLPEGKKQIIVFWATWCGPCGVEIGRLKSAVENGELSADDVTLVSVGEDPALVQKTVNEKQYPFRSLIDEQGKAAKFYKVSGTPTIVFLDESRKVEWVTTGLSPSLIWRAKRFVVP